MRIYAHTHAPHTLKHTQRPATYLCCPSQRPRRQQFPSPTSCEGRLQVVGLSVSKTRRMQRQGGWGRRGLGIFEYSATALACFVGALGMAAGGESVDASARAWAAQPARSRALGRSQAFAAYAPLHAAHALAGLRQSRPPEAGPADKATGRHARRLHGRQSHRTARAAAARDSRAEGVRGQALHSVLEELYGIVPGSKHVWSSLGSEEVTPLLQPLASRVRVVGLSGARHAAPSGCTCSARCHYGWRLSAA